MNASLIRLKEIFSESGVSCIRDLKRLSSQQFQRLDASVYGWFSSFRNDQIRALAETDGVNLCLGLKSTGEEYAVGAPMEMIVKKLVFFSETGVVLTPKFRYPGNSRRAVPDSWYYLALNYMPLWEAGMLTIMPKSVTHLSGRRSAASLPMKMIHFQRQDVTSRGTGLRPVNPKHRPEVCTTVFPAGL